MREFFIIRRPDGMTVVPDSKAGTDWLPIDDFGPGGIKSRAVTCGWSWAKSEPGQAYAFYEKAHAVARLDQCGEGAFVAAVKNVYEVEICLTDQVIEPSPGSIDGASEPSARIAQSLERIAEALTKDDRGGGSPWHAAFLAIVEEIKRGGGRIDAIRVASEAAGYGEEAALAIYDEARRFVSAEAFDDRMMREGATISFDRRHLMLLSRIRWRWSFGDGVGVCAVNPKRPYGNTGALADIAEILGSAGLGGGEAEEELLELHNETLIAVQIAVTLGRPEPGVEYRRVRLMGPWEIVS